VDISAAWIDHQFPSAIGKYRLTSERDSAYNCIAFAAGDKSRWWSHLPGYKWPAPRNGLISSLVAVFQSLGFEDLGLHGNAGREEGHVKVALYQKNGLWTHAARQLTSGKWTSKLGPDEDKYARMLMR
jgi:hypothetical protein